jgi:phosphoribosyl 1,2-cyclic phosphate phosphodiesterase
MRITILGSGTSHGIPVIGCSCQVCTSKNPKNNRTRSSVWVQEDGTSVLIDIGPEFRIQALRSGVNRVDALFLTHAHADHTHGLDDLRTLSREKIIPVYGNSQTLEEIRRRFAYIFEESHQGGGKPRISLEENATFPVRVGSLEIQAIPLMHGSLPVLGFRIGDFAFITDCSVIPEESLSLLTGLSVLVINALRYTPCSTHLSVSEAVAISEKLHPERTFLTHICHDVDHETLAKELPEKIKPAYDGLVLEV